MTISTVTMEKSAEAYKQFQNEGQAETLPTYNQAQNNYSIDQKVTENVHRTKKLAIVETVVCCLLLLLGITSTIMSSYISDYGPYAGPCVLGTSIWAPVIGVITAGLGLGALRYGNYSRSCLLVSHFVMSIISALASGILVIFTSICIASVSWLPGRYNYYDEDSYMNRYFSRIPIGMPEAVLAIEAFILIGALINMISNIVSSAFICQYWCGRKNTTPTVVYIPSQISSGNGPMQAISLPPGAQVVFLPQGANAPTQTHIPA